MEEKEPDGPKAQQGAKDNGLASKAFQYAKNHPISTGCACVGALAVAAPAIVATPALATCGFGANGVAAGSTAAAIQSGIGNVVAPGLFATLQSAGAGGYGVGVVHGATHVAGAVLGSVGGLGGFLSRRNKKNKESKSDAEKDEDSTSGDEHQDDGPMSSTGPQRRRLRLRERERSIPATQSFN
ncbi:hypothetical protein ACJZ2D_016064 [Fusarium nematophilum]